MTPDERAIDRVLASRPGLVGVRPAHEVVPGLDGRTVLHAAPETSWDALCPLLRSGASGALQFEGLAADAREARALLAAGEVRLGAAQDHRAMAGGAACITASTPMMVVEDAATGERACHPLMEGLGGKALIVGMYDADVARRLAWLRDVMAPALDAALQAIGGVDARALMAEALRRGDELHNRNAAASSLLAELLAPGFAAAGVEPDVVAGISGFVRSNPQFFVPVSLAASLLALGAADGIEGSSLVTGCGANGTDAGIRVAGLPGRWFTAPAEVPEGVLFPGFSPGDRGPGCGDSLLVECFGLGAAVLPAAPALWPVLGVDEERAKEITAAARRIALAEHPDYRVPLLGDAGAPVGVDARRVVETGIRPVIDIVLVAEGKGAIGFGLTSPPLECFEEAVAALG